MTQRTGRPPHPDVLTPAEWRVLHEVRAGHPNAEIAVRLGISVNTVKYHVSNMLAKLEVPDRHALAAWDGQPKRRFGWLPALPIGLPIGLGTLGRLTGLAGGLAAAAAVAAVVLASNGSATREPRTDVMLRLGIGINATALVALDPLTGAPLANAEPLDLTDRAGDPLAVDGSLFSYTRAPWLQPPAPDHGVITVVDGAAYGLAGSGLPMDADGVVQRWTLPETDDFSFTNTIAPPIGAIDQRIYVARFFGDEAPPELWALDLDSDQPHLLTTRPDITRLVRTTNGRLFLLERTERLPVPDVRDVTPEQLEVERARYAATARSRVIEISPIDGSELTRMEINGPTSTLSLTPDEQQLYVFTGQDRTVTVIDLDTMRPDTRNLPTGGPWPSAGPIGPFVSTEWSPDGEQLYLIGTDQALCEPGQPATQYCRPDEVGLRIVDLATNEVRYEDPQVNRLAVSPDGRWLVTAFRVLGTAGIGRDGGIKIVDPATFQVTAHLEPDTQFRQVVVGGDSKHAYALSDIERNILSDPCTEACAVVSVIDLDSLEVVATHTYDEPVIGLQTVY